MHGLNGDPHNTWTAEKSKIFWPAQLLPLILEEEKARILVYGYDADVTSFTDGASRDKIHNHAEHLIAELAANRRIRKATERPIIFVAHSLGGLVVKRALIYSSEIRGNYTEHLRSVFVSTYGILFLGTPHKGSDLAAWGSRLEAICSAVIPSRVVDSHDALVKALKTNNETLQNIDRQFIQLISRFHVYFFHEGKPTKLAHTTAFVVDEDSASPTIQDVERAVIQADHSHMCKFESDSSSGFDLVAEGIQRYAGEAPTVIASRWDSEHAERIAKKKAEIEEILPGESRSQAFHQRKWQHSGYDFRGQRTSHHLGAEILQLKGSVEVSVFRLPNMLSAISARNGFTSAPEASHSADRTPPTATSSEI